MNLRLPFADLPDRTWRAGTLLKLSWIPALIVFLIYWPVLGHGFLSDDEVILNYIFRQDVDEPELSWEVLGGDFLSPWLGLKHVGYYRPFINLIFAFSYVFGGLEPFHYYLHNICLHTIASVLTGLLCAMAVRVRPRLTFLVGSILFAIHPVGHEVVCWISARNSGIDVSLRLASMVCFCAAIRPRADWNNPGRARRRAHILTVVFAWSALMCKETAITLAVCYLALDVMIRPQRPFLERVRLHMLYGLVWLGYLFVRWMMVGMDLSKLPVGQGEAYMWKVWAGFQQRVSAFFRPRVDWDWVYTTESEIAGGIILAAFIVVAVWALLPMYLWALRPLLRKLSCEPTEPSLATGWHRVFWIVVGPVWAMLISFPNMNLPVDENLYGSRYLYASAAVILVVLCRITVGQAVLTRPTRLFLLATVLVVIPPMIYMDVRKIDHYRISSKERIVLQKQFDDIAADATDAKPIAIVMVQRPVRKVPFTNPNSLFTVAELPFARRNNPFVSLTTVLQNIELSGMAYDVEPMRAIWELGGKITVFRELPALREDGSADPTRMVRRFQTLGPPRKDPLPQPQRVAKNRYEFATLVSLFLVEGFRFYVPVVEGQSPPFADGTKENSHLRWVSWDGKIAEHRQGEELVSMKFPFRGPVGQSNGQWVYEVDIRADHWVMTMEFVGGLKGFEIVWKGDAEPSRVEVVRRVPKMKLKRLHHGATINLKDVGPSMLTPLIPQKIVGRKGYHIELVFMCGAYPLKVVSEKDPEDGSIEPGSAVVLPRRAEQLIEGMARLMRVDRFYYYFTVRGPGLGARSNIDWITVDVEQGARRRRSR